MTNFAACRSRRSVAKQAAIRETQSRATNRVGQSVISERLPFRATTSNGNQASEWNNNSGASIYSGHSSSTLSRASTYQRQVSSASSIRSHQTSSKHNTINENCCCKTGHQEHLNSEEANHGKQLNGAHLNRQSYNNRTGNQTDQTSVISLNYLSKSQKCGLCKEQIKFFREEFICGHVYHGDCLWRYEKLNASYDPNQCPKNCLRRVMMAKRTRSIESRSSDSSSSSSSSS